MRPYFIILFIGVLLFSFTDRKVRFIYIKEQLENAKAIRTIIVYKYTDTSMLYGMENTADTLSIRCGYNKTTQIAPNEFSKEKIDSQYELAGRWPYMGQKVLMVVDSNSKLKLFAIRINNDLRFWDPNSLPFANSIFIIKKDRSFKRLSVCMEVMNDSDYVTCTDGCLVEASAVKER